MLSAWERLQFATLELVRSTPIKQRLIMAYRRHLSVLTEDQLPGDVRESFRQLMASMRGKEPMRGEDAVAASVRKMSLQEADACAASVVEIFGLLSRQKQTGGRPAAAIVQLHGSAPDVSPAVEDDFSPAQLSRA